jgi:hypothetical protein
VHDRDGILSGIKTAKGIRSDGEKEHAAGRSEASMSDTHKTLVVCGHIIEYTSMRPATAKNLLDLHLKEMGRKYFKSGPPALVREWSVEDSHDDPVRDLAGGDDWIEYDPLDFGEQDDSERE